jgi:hypothetical protein
MYTGSTIHTFAIRAWPFERQGPTDRKEPLMATIADERAPIPGRRITAVSLAILALVVGLGLGIWQREPATDRTSGVERAEELSPEAVRVRNTAGLFVAGAFSPGPCGSGTPRECYRTRP